MIIYHTNGGSGVDVYILDTVFTLRTTTTLAVALVMVIIQGINWAPQITTLEQDLRLRAWR